MGNPTEKYMGMYNMIQGHVLRVTERRDHLTPDQQLQELDDLQGFLSGQVMAISVTKLRIQQKMDEAKAQNP